MIRSRPTTIQLSAKDVSFDTYELLRSRTLPKTRKTDRYPSAATQGKAPDGPLERSGSKKAMNTVIGGEDDCGNALPTTATMTSRHVIVSPSCSPQPPAIEIDDPACQHALNSRSLSLEFPIFDEKDSILVEPVSGSSKKTSSCPSFDSNPPSVVLGDESGVQDEDISLSVSVSGASSGSGDGISGHDNDYNDADGHNAPVIGEEADIISVQSPTVASLNEGSEAWPGPPVSAETYADASYVNRLPSPRIEIRRSRSRRLGFSLSLLRRRNRNRARRSTH